MMSKKSVPFSQDPHEVRLTKGEVVGRMGEGLYYEYPEQWVPDATGYVLDNWQKQVFRKLFLGGNAKPGASILDWGGEKKGKISVKACHSAGKTFTAGLLTHFFLSNFIPSKIALSGPTGKQTRSQVWSVIAQIWNRSVFQEDIEWFRTKMAFKALPEEWFALWLTSKEPKSIEGFHGPDEGKNLLWIIEESKGVEDRVFEAIQGALSCEQNYWYISSTCGIAHGFFFDTFHSKNDLWETVSVPYYESSRISSEQVRIWKKTWGEDSSIFRARVMAEFPEESDRIIVPNSWFQRAIIRNDDDDLEDAA